MVLVARMLSEHIQDIAHTTDYEFQHLKSVRSSDLQLVFHLISILFMINVCCFEAAQSCVYYNCTYKPT